MLRLGGWSLIPPLSPPRSCAHSYVRHTALAAAARGYRVVVVNHVGASGSPVTSPRLYSAGHTGDLRLALRHIAARYPAAPLFAAGWSLGANILVLGLGQAGAQVGGTMRECTTTTVISPFLLNTGRQHALGM